MKERGGEKEQQNMKFVTSIQSKIRHNMQIFNMPSKLRGSKVNLVKITVITGQVQMFMDTRWRSKVEAKH